LKTKVDHLVSAQIALKELEEQHAVRMHVTAPLLELLAHEQKLSQALVKSHNALQDQHRDGVIDVESRLLAAQSEADKHRKALEEAQVKVDALEKAKQGHEADMAELMSTTEREKAALKEDLVAKQAESETKAAEADALQKELAEKLDAALAQKDSELEAALQAGEEKFSARLAEEVKAKDALEQALRDAEQDHKAAIAELRTHLRAQMEAEHEKVRADLVAKVEADKEEELAERLALQAQAHQAAIDALGREHLAQRDTIIEEAQSTGRAENAQKLAEQAEAHDSAVAALKAEHTAAQDSLITSAKAEAEAYANGRIQQLQRDHQAVMEDLQAKHASTREAELLEAKATASKEHDDALAQLQERLAQAEKLASDRASDLANFEISAEASHDAEVSEWQSKSAAMEQQLNEVKQAEERLQSQLQVRIFRDIDRYVVLTMYLLTGARRKSCEGDHFGNGATCNPAAGRRFPAGWLESDLPDRLVPSLTTHLWLIRPPTSPCSRSWQTCGHSSSSETSSQLRRLPPRKRRRRRPNNLSWTCRHPYTRRKHSYDSLRISASGRTPSCKMPRR
jgi:hypothetical protein